MRRSLQQALAIVCALTLVTAGPIAFEQGTGTDVPSADDLVGEVDAIAATTALAGGIVIGTVGTATYDYLTDDEADTTQTDADQVWADITQSAKAQWDKDQVIQAAYSNYLNDTQSIGRMIGKNAYIRSLENGSSQSVAEQEAREAIGDYYAMKQINLIKSWNASVTHGEYLANTTFTEQGITETDVWSASTNLTTYSLYDGNGFDSSANPFNNSPARSLSLVNGTNAGANSIKLHYDGAGSSFKVAPSGVYDNTGTGSIEYLNMTVQAPSSIDYVSDVTYIQSEQYVQKWNNIEQQNTQVQNEVTTFINDTYSKWDAGKINSSDLVDPYIGAREYSPEQDYQTWALSSYSSLGLNSPTNLSEFGSMTVTDETTGINYTGILMSDSNPPSGQFDVGTKYYASNFTGPVYVVTSTDSYQMDGPFTIQSAENIHGEAVQNVSYQDVSYQTANLSELSGLTDQLKTLRTELEQREQRIEDSSGGLFSGLGLGGLGNLPQGLVILLGGGLLLLLVVRG